MFIRALRFTSHSGTELEIMGKTICAEIMDCVNVNIPDFNVINSTEWLASIDSIRNDPSIEGYTTFEGFDYNADLVKIGEKLLVISNKEIAADEEIYFNYGKEYWYPLLRSYSYNKYVESDLLNIELKPTLLPVPGSNGVFAKNGFKANDIICEHTGPIIAAEHLSLVEEHAMIRFIARFSFTGFFIDIVCTDLSAPKGQIMYRIIF